MARVLLTIGSLQECDTLIRTALMNEWSVLNTVLTDDIPAALERKNVDLVVMSNSFSAAEWALASSHVWSADCRTPIIICDSRDNMVSLRSFFNCATGSGAIEHPAAFDEIQFCLLALSPSLSLFEATVGHRHVGIDRALALIEARYAEPLSLADAASEACYSRCHFSKIFKLHVGVAFTTYVARVRARHAADLLICTNRSITDIAYNVGFNDLSNFERVFRYVHDQSPSKYRQESKKMLIVPKNTPSHLFSETL